MSNPNSHTTLESPFVDAVIALGGWMKETQLEQGELLRSLRLQRNSSIRFQSQHSIDYHIQSISGWGEDEAFIEANESRGRG